MNKAYEYRFTPLNKNAPLHRPAINALSAQGRRKSQFVVNAITHYIMTGGDEAKTQTVQPNRDYIEQICLEVFQRCFAEQECSERLKKPQEEGNDTSTYDIDADTALIAEAMSQFRKNP